MPFSEATKKVIRQKADYRCCACGARSVSIQVHHIIPEENLVEDDPLRADPENGAPLCAKCHDDYGGNPKKRKMIREMRDYLYQEVANAKASVDLAPILALAQTVDEIRSAVAGIAQHLGVSADREPETIPAETTEDRVVTSYFTARHDELLATTANSLKTAGYSVSIPFDGAADLGIDLLAEKDGRRLAIEVKRWDGVPPAELLANTERHLREAAFQLAAVPYLVVDSKDLADLISSRGAPAVAVSSFEEEAEGYEDRCLGCVHFCEYEADGGDGPGDTEIWYQCEHPTSPKEFDAQLFHTSWGDRSTSDYPRRCEHYDEGD